MKEKIKNKVKEERKKLKKERDSFFTDFKKFISKGNVLDLAVAVVIATAFNAIVTGLVKYIITPGVSYFTKNGAAVEEWKTVLRPEVLDAAGEVVEAEIALMYGMWLQTIVDFLIIAFCIFLAVRIINNVKRTFNKKQEALQKIEEEKKKAKEEIEKAEAARIEAERKAALEEFYNNTREQVMLLKEIKESLNKK